MCRATANLRQSASQHVGISSVTENHEEFETRRSTQLSQAERVVEERGGRKDITSINMRRTGGYMNEIRK